MGIRLTSVEFVIDYIQLHFEVHTLSALTHPAVYMAGTWYRSGDCRYRDMLCECITKPVHRTIVIPGERIEIEFTDGALIRISLREEDHVDGQGEAALFDLNDPQGGWVW